MENSNIEIIEENKEKDENETNKNGKKLVRDENGRVVAGVLNPNGRPKKGMTLTDITREILEEELGNGVTRKEALMRKVANLAFEGNETMIKLIWNYVDGMPIQKTNLTGELAINKLLNELTSEKDDFDAMNIQTLENEDENKA